MGSMANRSAWTKFWRLDGADKRLVLQAMLALAVARIQLTRYSFEQLAARLEAVPDLRAGTADARLLQRISYAIGAAAGYVPWRSDCFPQCIAARALLGKRGLASTIHLGVERVGESGLEGHAWLTCADTVVAGGGVDLDRFTELHRFPG